ncbi:MAG: hypothetical protein KatS3mg057_0388 [Herpetosiphonaceae bacterium]|nr:MAG: hypothetical protein KatS3mg057_0388 [Herpetosiphonaceae bacterium]
MPHHRRLFFSIVAGLCGSVVCLIFRAAAHDNGDFWWSLHMAMAVLNGTDPYAGLREANMVAYPLPIAAVGLLFLWVPNIGASTMFVGISTGLLAYGALRDETPWELGVLLSAPYIIAVKYAQWGIIVLALGHLRFLLPVILIKPQIALPVALTRKPSLLGLILTAGILLLSFIILPDWPVRWLATVGSYQRVIPILVLPFGPLLFLALLRWRTPNSWLLVLMSVLPHRAIYDLLSLWLLTRSWRQSLLLAALSWVIAFSSLAYDQAVVSLLFLPCLGLIFINHSRGKYTPISSTKHNKAETIS